MLTFRADRIIIHEVRTPPCARNLPKPGASTSDQQLAKKAWSQELFSRPTHQVVPFTFVAIFPPLHRLATTINCYPRHASSQHHYAHPSSHGSSLPQVLLFGSDRFFGLLGLARVLRPTRERVVGLRLARVLRPFRERVAGLGLAWVLRPTRERVVAWLLIIVDSHRQIGNCRGALSGGFGAITSRPSFE